MKDFIDEIPNEVAGTDINRANMMAVQGFVNFTFARTSTGIQIIYNIGNNITETLSVSVSNGQIVESYESDDATITMTTTSITGGYKAVIE